MTPEAGLLVGEALHELGRFDEAEQVLSDASAEDTPDGALRVQLTEIRSRNLMWGLLRFDDALAVNRAGRTQVEDPADVEELDLNEALLLVYSGRPLDALGALGTHHLPDPAASPGPPCARRGAGAGGDRAERAGRRGGRPGLRRALGAARADRHPRSRRPPRHPGLRAGRVRPAGRGERAGHGGLRGHAGQRAARRADLVRAPARPMRAPVRAPGDRPPVAGRGARPVRGLRAGERPSPGAVRAGDRARLAGRRRRRRPRPSASSTVSRRTRSWPPSTRWGGPGRRRWPATCPAPARSFAPPPRRPPPAATGCRRRGCCTTSPASATRARSPAVWPSWPASARAGWSPPTPITPRPGRRLRSST